MVKLVNGKIRNGKTSRAQENGENVKRDRAGNRYEWQNGETVKRAKMAKLVNGKTAKPAGSVKMVIMLKPARPEIDSNGKMVKLASALKWLSW